ncbi:MAG TPA: AEC family transporter [Rhodopila sp.]|uniref:AEC family transporter n=1 Tax=Rhodopila sp. TaxID=2480087 RepID=UPI002B7EFF2D|nr:AEC family transporter [Rhodopila sp.]HVY18281.1 AEC family transporter [Rhodopila sp.]
MLSPLLIVLPIFGLIFAGWLVRRLGVLGPHATTELNRFVIYLALPALLFDVIAHARLADVWQPGFVAAFGLSAAAMFLLTLWLPLLRPRHFVDAVIDGLNAGYANVGFVGFPLTLVALGRAALAPTLIATIITVCVLFGIAVVLIEIGLQTEKRRRHLVAKVGGSLLRNPLLVAPVLGALVPVCGLAVPAPVESFLKLLGGAASPCALVALGLFLAAERPAARDAASRRDFGVSALLVGFKLVLQPVVAWVLAALVFQLPPLLTHAAVLLAALPTGTGPFMLAEFYRREAGVTGRVVLGSTVVSVVTITGYLGVAG